jgi:hypothetical protein
MTTTEPIMTDNPQPGKQPPKQETEWTFSFENFGESIAQVLNQFGIGADADLRETTFVEPLADASRATVRLDLTIGHVKIEALPADSDKLIEAEVTSIGAVEMVTATEGDAKSVRLRQKRTTDADLFKPVKDAVDAVAHNPELQWTVRLSPRLPIRLIVNAGLTLDTFDLSGLNLQRLSVDSGTGTTKVTFPAGVTVAEVEGGVGVLEMTVPDGANTTLNLDIGAGSTVLHVGDANLRAEIEGGVGNCEVSIPAGAALRVRGESGLGNIDVPHRAEAVQFESEFISESGTWQTADFAFAQQKIDIRYDGGVGSLIIRERDA